MKRTVRSFPLSIAVVLLTGLLVCLATVWHLYGANGQGGFPVDDAWIHLQFARNLTDSGTYAYSPGDPATSGSTSPLYTLLLSVGLLFTRDEFFLSYTLGVFFLLLSGYAMFRVCALEFADEPLVAAIGALLLVCEPRLLWVSLSGMETTMFTALLLGTAFFWRRQQGVLLGLTTGLLLWTRPEALIMIGCLFITTLYSVIHGGRRNRKDVELPGGPGWRLRSIMVFGGFAVAYAGFNFALSGTFLPNTAAAKITYYSSGEHEYWAEAWAFFTGGHLSVLSLFAGVGMVHQLYHIFRGSAGPIFLPSLLWVCGLTLAYALYLPYLYHEGRYLMPVLPFLLLLGLSGLKVVMDRLPKVFHAFRKTMARRSTQVALLALLVGQFSYASWEKAQLFAADCLYINDRQVRTALWLRDNLPRDAVIATHDIGAVGFYSGCRIVDMVGLVSPEMIPNLGNLSKLKDFLVTQKVTHLAVLRNWFEVDNQHPLYMTDERFPEVMEVFAFDPARTHFVPGPVQQLWIEALGRGNAVEAERLLNRAILLDPACSRSHYLLGLAQFRMGRMNDAEAQFRTSLALKPGNPEARLALAEIVLKREGPARAAEKIREILREYPAYLPALRALEVTSTLMVSDSTGAQRHTNE